MSDDTALKIIVGIMLVSFFAPFINTLVKNGGLLNAITFGVINCVIFTFFSLAAVASGGKGYNFHDDDV